MSCELGGGTDLCRAVVHDVLVDAESISDSCRVYTPPFLASALVNALRQGEVDSWLEPSFGHGVFLAALAGVDVPSARVTALEIDSDEKGCDSLARCIRGVDALSWMKQTSERFDNVVGNPPYLALSSVRGEVLTAALGWTLPNGGGRLSKNANLWISFVYAAIGVLKQGGSLGFILPAAFEFATYAASLRASLPRIFESVKVVRSERSLFVEVQDGCVVLICKGFGGSTESIDRRECVGLSAVVDAISNDGGSVRIATRETRNPTGPRLSDLGRIRIGAVTGDIRYFVLRESQRRDLGLPESCLLPILSKGRHLDGGAIDIKWWRKLRDMDEPVLLFRPVGDLLRRKSVKHYIELGLNGMCNLQSFKLTARTPWWEVPLPKRPDYFLSPGFRPGAQVAKNSSRAVTCTNSIYGFYFHKETPLIWRGALEKAFESEEVNAQLQRVARRYASGLRKLEPSDYAEIRLPTIHELSQ